jgi:hypothetical protein
MYRPTAFGTGTGNPCAAMANANVKQMTVEASLMAGKVALGCCWDVVLKVLLHYLYHFSGCLLLSISITPSS